MSPQNKNPSREKVWEMFDDISPTYDRINQILSLGLDRKFRKKLVEFLPKKQSLKLLDIATGTAEQIIAILNESDSIDEAVGLDLSKKMLAIGRKKIQEKFYHGKVSLKEGSSDALPFEENSFDVITISFGIRNVQNLEKTFSEIKRVLKKDGRLLILEFSLPENLFIKKLHLFYLRRILPHLGGILSKNRKAYRYLNETIETFPYGQAFQKLLENHGWKDVKASPLFFGAVHVYQAENL